MSNFPSPSFKMKLLLSIIVLFVIKNVETSVPYEVINKYFSNQMVGAVNVFFCTSKEGAVFMKTKPKVLTTVRVSKDDFDGSFNRFFISRHYKVGTFLDFRCDQAKLLFDEVSNYQLLNMTNVFLIYTDKYQETVDYLNNTSLAFDSDLAVLSNETIFEIYKVQTYLPVKSNRIGTWTYNGSFELEERKPRVDLEGTAIKAAIVITKLQLNESNVQEQLLDFTLDRELDVLTRFAFTVQKHLELIYNFRISLRTTQDWGYFDESTGHFPTGTMFGLMEQNEVDLGLVASRIFSERLAVSFFAPPIKKFKSCFVFRHPQTLADYTAFAMPFTLPSWICIFIMMFVIAVGVSIIRSYNISDSPPNEPSFPASVLFIIGIICQQGLYVNTLRTPIRVLAVFSEIASILIYAYYGAEVIGFLLTPSPKTINTIDKLIDSPIDMWAENLTYHRTHFTGNLNEKATKAYYHALKGPTLEQDKFINLTIGIRKVQKGGFALYGYYSNLYTVIEEQFSIPEKCSLTEIEMINMWLSTNVRKKSPFKEIAYKGTMFVRENGLLLREDRNWHTQKPECIGQEESASVKLEATLIAQATITLGFLLAVIIYLVEIKITLIKRNKLVRRAQK